MSELSLYDWQSILEKLCSCNTRLHLDNKLDKKGIIKECFSNKFIHDTLSQWLAVQSQLCKWKKSKEKSIKYRAEGNSFYTKGYVYQSLRYYTNAVLLAPKDSEELQLAFGNRSAALFSMKKYQECISDIKYALSCNKTPSIRDIRLLIRKAKALECINNFIEGQEAYELANYMLIRCVEKDQKRLHRLKDEIQQGLSNLKHVAKPPKNEVNSSKTEEEFKLIMDSFSAKTEFPSASSKLALMKNSIKGRHVIARENLSVGEVIFIEKPFAFVVLPDYSSDHCQACCKKILNPLPCKHCIEACFCSQQCRRIAWNKFHKWECGFGLKLSYMIGIAHLGFRVALIGFTEPSNPEYQRVKDLQQHIHSLEADDLYQYTLTATVLVIYLENFTNIMMGPNRIESLLEIGGLILLHIAQLVCNGHAITAIMQEESVAGKILNEEQVRIATAIYPSASMMNHSCDPSIINGFKDEYLIVRAIRNIKKGEEVYNCYGPHFRRMSRQERQSSLLQQYMFLCKCEQCTSEEDFIERFTGYRCQNETCGGIVPIHGRICPKCLISLREDCVTSVEKAVAFMYSAKEAASDKNFQKGVQLAEKALKLYSLHLYKHHKYILECKDFLAKMLIYLGHNYKSYKYIEENIIGNKERFGNKSVEVGNELLKLCDVAVTVLEMYMEKKDTIKKNESNILGYIEEAQEIFKLCNGKMHRTYQELEDLKNIFEFKIPVYFSSYT
ncbi:SET and MYND domain-containing protein 4-like isoform X2 [Rhodnius prolixus]|uniref:SET and MYND domain-containing protein 4-like isoform X2 n=1 Tax=Rhodnius prolixus TaxID=13249 RepID=UPI003D18E46D